MSDQLVPGIDAAGDEDTILIGREGKVFKVVREDPGVIDPPKRPPDPTLAPGGLSHASGKQAFMPGPITGIWPRVPEQTFFGAAFRNDGCAEFLLCFRGT